MWENKTLLDLAKKLQIFHVFHDTLSTRCNSEKVREREKERERERERGWGDRERERVRENERQREWINQYLM